MRSALIFICLLSGCAAQHADGVIQGSLCPPQQHTVTVDRCCINTLGLPIKKLCINSSTIHTLYTTAQEIHLTNTVIHQLYGEKPRFVTIYMDQNSAIKAVVFKKSGIIRMPLSQQAHSVPTSTQ